MPPKLPTVEPIIPPSLVFIALTMVDPEAPVAIMHFDTMRRIIPDLPPQPWPATQENIDAEIRQAGFQVRFWKIIRYEEIPKDRTYRDALRHDGQTLYHHVETAKKIAVRHTREDRVEELAALDIQWTRAMGQGKLDVAARVEAKRQALRDRPEALATLLQDATTVDEIHARVAETIVDTTV